jgi:hypothetical protein
MFFVQDYRERLKSENPDATFGEVGKLLGAKWKEMSAGEKKVGTGVLSCFTSTPAYFVLKTLPLLSPSSTLSSRRTSPHNFLRFLEED